MKAWRQVVRRRVLLLIPVVLVLWWFLPYDHPLRLAVRFNFYSVTSTIPSSFPDRWWLTEDSKFPVDLSKDVAVVVKSGFGTKDRIPAWLEAHEQDNFANILLVADFASQPEESFKYNSQELPVQDLVAWMLENEIFPAHLEHPRLVKYSSLKAAISSGDDDAARELSRSFGWELDAFKFISGLELIYDLMPNKKWYLMVDDDTYLVRPSLQRLIQHLDPKVPYYVGNAVGDYKGRFAHGGSSVIISQATMRQLFANDDVVSEAHMESLEETWGDKLLATTLMKLGIYLDEEYVIFFNGGQPQTTRLTKERFCAPIVSFHGLASTSDMEGVGKTFKKATESVLWIDLWKIYDAPSLDSPVLEAGKENWDYVGRLDEHTMSIKDIPTAQACYETCQGHSRFCLAWTWESKEQACHLSPWMVIGAQAEGKTSGVNVPRVQSFAAVCRTW